MTIRNSRIPIIAAILFIVIGRISYAQGDDTLRRIRIPILMYHYVSPLPQEADDIRINLTVTPDQFDAQMRYLQQQGYTSISLHEVYQALYFGDPLPSKPIVITFDDGYDDAYTYALPVLRKYNLQGTFFIITGYVDNANPQHLNWTQIQEMSEAGMHIENHTKSHVDLRNSDYNRLVYEIIGAKESIEAHTGKTSFALAYPMGRYDNQVVDLLKAFPVQTAVTTQAGTLQTSSAILELSRLRVSNDTTVYGLDRLLNQK